MVAAVGAATAAAATPYAAAAAATQRRVTAPAVRAESRGADVADQRSHVLVPRVLLGKKANGVPKASLHSMKRPKRNRVGEGNVVLIRNEYVGPTDVTGKRFAKLAVETATSAYLYTGSACPENLTNFDSRAAPTLLGKKLLLSNAKTLTFRSSFTSSSSSPFPVTLASSRGRTCSAGQVRRAIQHFTRQ